MTAMKAMVRHRYGSPEVLELKDVPKPTPGDNDILIRIKAVSLNPLDWHYMRGTPFFFRFASGFPKPKHTIIGADMSGVIEAIGKNVQP